jgi:hypothetical protein
VEKNRVYALRRQQEKKPCTTNSTNLWGRITTMTFPTLLSTWRFWLAAAILVGLAAAWWYNSSYPRWRVTRDLQAARTAADERQLFERIRRTSQVRFTAHDASGASLPTSQPGWQSAARTLRFYQYGNPAIEHSLIDPENITRLTGE